MGYGGVQRLYEQRLEIGGVIKGGRGVDKTTTSTHDHHGRLEETHLLGPLTYLALWRRA